jgi:hypothetical protein
MIKPLGKPQHFLSFLLIITILYGCGLKEENKNISTDLNAFNNIVTIDIPFNSIIWEVFGTPEYTGGVPGPTDYLTLVAQIEPSNDAKFDNRPATGSIWVAPESARPWMEADFRRLLEDFKGEQMDMAKRKNCRAITAVLRQTSKQVKGFVCRSETKVLVYIRVASFT